MSAKQERVGQKLNAIYDSTRALGKNLMDEPCRIGQLSILIGKVRGVAREWLEIPLMESEKSTKLYDVPKQRC